MSEKAASPFSRLDKALLRSTRPAADAVDERVPTRPSAADRAAQARPASPTQELSTQDSHTASTPASVLARHEDEIIEAIRKTVKTPGREVSFVRLTADEKGQLADIVYTYKRQGIKTSETEVNRIAVNYLIADYKANGEQSVLARVIAALLA